MQRKSGVILFLVTISVIYAWSSYYLPLQHLKAVQYRTDLWTKYRSTANTNSKIWISMALCWGENAHVHGKKSFPYPHAALRAVSLWHKLTEARVIIQLVHSGSITQSLLQYRSELQKEGAYVYLNKTEDNVSCVLTSQIIRMLAFQLEVVEKDDVVITADVDAFITSDHILDPVTLSGNVIWLWRYGHTLKQGEDFAITFIGAKSWIWRSMLHFEGSISNMYSHYEKITKNGNMWQTDQYMVSQSILESGLCILPADNSLWKKVNLIAPPTNNYSGDVCWKGEEKDWGNCVKTLERPEGMTRCTWWHFLPSDGVQELDERYWKILSRGDAID